MWLDNLRQIKQDSGMKTAEIAERAKLPERTVRRVLKGETDSPYLDTLHRIADALGTTLNDIFADTNAIVGGKEVAALHEELEAAKTVQQAMLAEIELLQKQIKDATSEIDFLRRELQHKEELLAVHNYYTKIKSGG